jgi:cytochrome P450
MTDTWLDGKFLPKDSIIIVNVFGLHHDSSSFARADDFHPAHFADKPKLASEYANLADYEARDHYAYGTGRRICPGIHFAERSLFIAVAKILWAFDITQNPKAPIDSDVVTGYADGLLVGPKEFTCSIRVRSKARRETIIRELRDAQVIFSAFAVDE